MQTRIYKYFALLLAGIALATQNASAAPNYDSKEPQPVNLYKALYEYIGAVVGQGIPALQVLPLDPYQKNVTLELLQSFSPGINNFTDLDVISTGIEIYGFGNYAVKTADLNLDELLANLTLKYPYLNFALQSVNITAFDQFGKYVQLHCSHVYGGVLGLVLNSVKSLELNGAQLHVKTLQADYQWDDYYALISLNECSGETDLVGNTLDLVIDVLGDLLKKQIPAGIHALSDNITLALNDIFALRNVTDDSVGSSTKLDTANMELKLETGDEAVKRTMTRSAYQKSSREQQNEDSIKVKWIL